MAKNRFLKDANNPFNKPRVKRLDTVSRETLDTLQNINKVLASFNYNKDIIEALNRLESFITKLKMPEDIKVSNLAQIQEVKGQVATTILNWPKSLTEVDKGSKKASLEATLVNAAKIEKLLGQISDNLSKNKVSVPQTLNFELGKDDKKPLIVQWTRKDFDKLLRAVGTPSGFEAQMVSYLKTISESGGGGGIVGGIVGLKNIAGTQIDPATDTTVLLAKAVLDNIYARQADGTQKAELINEMPVGQADSANSFAVVLSNEQQTILSAIKTKTDNIPALGQALAAASVPVILPAATITTLTPPAAITGFATQATLALIKDTDGIKKIVDPVTVTNAGTFPVQDKYVLPLATNAVGTLTLTSASTAYQITEPTSDFIVTFCNMSDTDMYWGFATLTSGGVLLPKNGGTLILKCVASNSPFFYCASAGKVLNYSTTLI